MKDPIIDDEDDNEVARVSCGTTAGDIVLELKRQWSPHGYDRAVELFERGYYDHSHFFRTVPGFLVQFGISYSNDRELIQLGKSTIPDDPQLQPPIKFEEGTISYAGTVLIIYQNHKMLGSYRPTKTD